MSSRYKKRISTNVPLVVLRFSIDPRRFFNSVTRANAYTHGSLPSSRGESHEKYELISDRKREREQFSWDEVARVKFLKISRGYPSHNGVSFPRYNKWCTRAPYGEILEISAKASELFYTSLLLVFPSSH